MSVIMTMWLKGDPAALEQYAQENPGKLEAIRDHAAEHGLIAHRFYGADGQILIVDEWPDAESFQGFFGHVAGDVAPAMEAAGVTEEPRPVFWHKLDTQDDYGWGA
jgi:hypothetical protein